MKTKLDILKEYFGHSEFKEGQDEVIDCLLSGRDVLCIMPTGAGKSVCYQIPALLFEGVTIVISPLISLMKDQVGSLRQAGISAAYINSTLSFEQHNRVIQAAGQGRYKIIYVAPERLTTEDFLRLCSVLKLSMIVIDEAHCVSQWGQDFRPSYLKIKDFIHSIRVRPTVGAFTATATGEVKADIFKLLGLDNPLLVSTGFDRQNLFFGVERPKNKGAALLKLVKQRRGQSGIVYCATRKVTEEVCALLNEQGFSATRYHAGLSDTERKANQEDFVFDRRQIMVATNAFGMGIDKSNVGYVIHYNMPKSLESYYQEAGRAGRDGEAADCILLYSPQDVRTNRFLIERGEINSELSDEEREAVRERNQERLRLMTFYSTTNDCLRAYILKYFGDKSLSYCGKCSNCLTKYEKVDITVEAQKILSCIKRTGERYGRGMLCDILRGSKNKRLLQSGLDNQSTYGIMKDVSEKRLRDLMSSLEQEGYIETEDGEYPIIKLMPKSYDLMRGNSELVLRIPKEEKKEKLPKKAKSGTQDTLLDRLKQLRYEIASREHVPAYMIFTNATLSDMCVKRPRNKAELLDVSGVGMAKQARYGTDFLELIRDYEAEQLTK
ncbi:MAG: DNA helicase RecQ [Clostridia bacterium]|nr:DNA helicase RecQ [Clostridia bacterium]